MALVRLLVVLGVIFGVLSLFAGYVRWQVFDTPTWKDTSEELIQDQQVRDQIATSLVDAIYDNVDVASALQQRLPAEQKGLSAVIAGAVRELSDRAAQRLLERPRVQTLWVDSTVRAQQQVERLLDDDTTAVQTEGGYAVLNLRPLVVQLGDRIAVVSTLNARLPDDAGVIRLFKADQLETAQNATQLFKSVAVVIWIVPLALFGFAIWLARGRRRQAVRMVAVAFVFTGLLVLVLRKVAGTYVVDALAEDAVRPAVTSAWNIITSLLADGAWTAVGIGVVTLFGTWLAGPTTSAGRVRRRVAPYAVRPEYAFGAAALFLLLVIWWGPTAQTRRWFYVLLVAILLAVGVELLRRVIAREEPEAVAAAADEEPTLPPAPPPPPPSDPPSTVTG